MDYEKIRGKSSRHMSINGNFYNSPNLREDGMSQGDFEKYLNNTLLQDQ